MYPPQLPPSRNAGGRAIAGIAGLGLVGLILCVVTSAFAGFLSAQPCPLEMECDTQGFGLLMALMLVIPVTTWIAGLALALANRQRSSGPYLMAGGVALGALSWLIGITIFLVTS